MGERIEVWQITTVRPSLPRHCVAVRPTTRGLGQHTIESRRIIPAEATWGWWRDQGGLQTVLPHLWSHHPHFADLEPDAWKSGRALTESELVAVDRCAGVTSWGYPRRVAAALRPFADRKRRGIIQLYRDGTAARLAHRASIRRIASWRALGFADLTGIIGGERSGPAWNDEVLRVCAGEGLGVAVWGYDREAARTAERAFHAGLGRGGEGQWT